MYQRILIALDDSPMSRVALQHTVGLARSVSAVLYVMHVVEDEDQRFDVSGVDIADLETTRRDAGQSVLDDAMELVRASGITCESALIPTHGRPISETILDAAHEWGVDLIAMGTRGREGISRLIAGSVAEDVMRHADVPVLLVPGTNAPLR